MGLRKDIKKLLVPNKVPAATSFKVDEIVINPIDGKAYIKKTDNTVIELGSGGDSAFTTEISASFSSSIAALETGGTGVQAASVSGAIDVATGSLLITASAFTTNTLQFTKGDASTFNVVHTASLSEALTTTLNSDVGAVSNNTTFAAGTSIESLLRQLLIDFIPPTFTNFTITNLDTAIEVGDQEPSTINAGTFTTASSTSDGTGFENNGGSFGLVLSNNATDNGTISATFNSNNISFSAITIKRTSVGNATFTLTGTDSQGNVTARSDSAKFRLPIFYGGSPNDGSAGNDAALADILSDISSSITSTTGTSQILVTSTTDANFGKQTLISPTSTTSIPNNLTIVLPASVQDTNNFCYIIIPSSFNNIASIVRDGSVVETGTFGSPLFTANHERFSGINTEYKIYRSAGKGPFDEGAVLVIND